MDGFDFFRRFLGLPSDQRSNPFKNPIWDEYEDEDELDLDMDFGVGPGSQGPVPGFGFRVFTGDPFDMHRHFENQMDDVIRSFMGLMGPSHHGFADFPDTGSPRIDGPDQPIPSIENHPRNKYLKPSYENIGPAPRADSDVDGRITGKDIDEVFKQGEPAAPRRPLFGFSERAFSGAWQSSPGGRIESRKTLKLSDGTEQTTITRQFGEQTHSVTVKKNKDGTVEQTEDFVNMDEDDLNRFNQLWERGAIPPNLVPSIEPVPNQEGESLTKKLLKWFK